MFSVENLSDRFEFKNFYVNKIKIWKYEMNLFCISCDEVDHIVKNCINDKLKNWKRFHLKIMIYENRVNSVNSINLEFEKFSSFDSEFIFLTSIIYEKSVIFFHSVTVKFDFEIRNLSFNIFIQFFFKKKSGLNKKAHMKNSFFIQQQIVSRFSEFQITVFSIIFSFVIFQITTSSVSERSIIQSVSIQSAAFLFNFIFQINFFQFIYLNLSFISQNQSKRKKQRRVIKKTEMQFIIDLMNDFIETYDKFVFIRNVLKQNKIDINFMNWIVWFFAVCRKIKRFCIKIFKQRIKKLIFVFMLSFN